MSEITTTKDGIEVVASKPLDIPCMTRQERLDSIFEAAKRNVVTDWVPKFLKLLELSNSSPLRCAEALGIAWNAVLREAEKLRRSGNTELLDAINMSKRAYAERIMLHPETYSGNSAMAIFMVKALAGWTEGAINEFGVPNDVELEKILDARNQLCETLEEVDKNYNTRALKLTG